MNLSYSLNNQFDQDQYAMILGHVLAQHPGGFIIPTRFGMVFLNGVAH